MHGLVHGHLPLDDAVHRLADGHLDPMLPVGHGHHRARRMHALGERPAGAEDVFELLTLAQRVAQRHVAGPWVLWAVGSGAAGAPIAPSASRSARPVQCRSGQAPQSRAPSAQRGRWPHNAALDDARRNR